MSVQNGERLATKQDLADMYQGILPYLGGMPEMLANKFSKGDLYSTDEKMIGQWIDGKPIYQKVVILDFTKSSTTREYVNILDMSSYSVDTFVNGFGSFINDISSDVKTKIFTLADQNARATIVYDRSTKYLQLLCYEMNGWKIKGCVTIQYTKTTDSAISIGDDTDYSTTEKIVGTWIDGKPVYQKTIHISSLPNNTTAEYLHNISYLDKVIDIKCIYWNSTQTGFQPFPQISVDDVSSQDIVSVTNTAIYIATKTDKSSKSAYITLQYTKTT